MRQIRGMDAAEVKLRHETDTAKPGVYSCAAPYHDRETKKDYVFLTTNFALSARTIADIYKSRWQVGLFFKSIKQNLKVKSFVGTTRNAVMTQIWIAMCMYLILSYIQFSNRIAWRPSKILRLLQLNLFERRPLLELLGSGNESPPDPFIPVDDEVQGRLIRRDTS